MAAGKATQQRVFGVRPERGARGCVGTVLHGGGTPRCSKVPRGAVPGCRKGKDFSSGIHEYRTRCYRAGRW